MVAPGIEGSNGHEESHAYEINDDRDMRAELIEQYSRKFRHQEREQGGVPLRLIEDILRKFRGKAPRPTVSFDIAFPEPMIDTSTLRAQPVGQDTKEISECQHCYK